MLNKGFLIVLMAALLLSDASGQLNEKSKLTLGTYVGLDFNQNAYRQTDDIYGFSYQAGNATPSGGIEFGYFVTKRFRPRLQFQYSGLSYDRDWNLGPDTDFDHTKTVVHYFGTNLKLDYGLYMGERFQVFLSPGINTELEVFRRYKTYLNDEDDPVITEYSLLEDEHPGAIGGLSLSMPLRFMLSDQFKLKLEPEYTYWLRKFVPGNSDPYSRLSLKLGIEYTF